MQGFCHTRRKMQLEIIQECAQNFKELSDTTSYTFHTSLGKKISVFDVDFKPGDFHHAAGLQYLTDISIPRNVNKAIPWILDKKKPITDDYLAKSKGYKGKANQERDIELRISELRFLEEYLDQENIVYIYSPKDSPRNNSIIPCNYIIKSHSSKRNQTVFIFLIHRAGKDSPCRIISFGVRKNVEYAGIYQYVMLKDKTINGNRINVYRHPKYTDEQIVANEPDVNADYLTLNKEED